MSENILIEVTIRERIRGGWGKFIHENKTVEEVGTLIRRKQELHKTGDIFKATPRGEKVLVSFCGTMTEIANCYKAAGDEIYLAKYHRR